MPPQELLIFIAGAILALLLTPAARALAVLLGAFGRVQDPRAESPVAPSLGGVAVLLAFLGTVLTALLLTSDPAVARALKIYAWPTAGALTLAIAGAADDVRRIRPATKLIFQALAATTVVFADQGITAIVNPFTGQTIETYGLSYPATILWIIGVTNAVNLLDGLDGLAAGAAVIACAAFWAAAWIAGGSAAVPSALAGVMAGFLYYNFHPARIILGDSGSLPLGFLLAVLSLKVSQTESGALMPLPPVFALWLPITDLWLATARRSRAHLRTLPIFPKPAWHQRLRATWATLSARDENHIHHRLLRMGLRYRRAVMILYGISVILGLFALLSLHGNAATNTTLLAVTSLGTCFGLRKLGYF